MDILKRRETKQVKVGPYILGSGNPIRIQSMTTTRPSDIEETLNQIEKLENEGCEIIRVAVPTLADASALKVIKEKINIPLVADIHFDYKLAIESIRNGIDKLRINPGNIGDEEKIRAVVAEAKKYGIPIRIGVNAGSLEKEILEKFVCALSPCF